MDKTKKIDFYVFVLIVLFVLFYSCILKIAYPYEILDWDTISWLEHAKYFSLLSHAPMESCRRLPFGLMLLFSTKFSNPTLPVYLMHLCLFVISIYSFYLLSKHFLKNIYLQIFATIFLLMFSLLVQKLFFFNAVLLPEATSAYLFFIGANIALLAFFRVNYRYLLLAYIILGIGAFSKGNTVCLIPVWLLFLLIIRNRFKRSILYSCFLLLVSPTVLYELRGLYIGGNQGYHANEYLLVRVLPLLKSDDRITEDTELNKQIYQTLEHYISTSSEYQVSPFDALLGMADYSYSGQKTWKELLILASGIKHGGNVQLAYQGATLNLAKKIILLHFREYFDLVIKRYLNVLNTFNLCGFMISEGTEYRYKNFNKLTNQAINTKNIFFSENEKFFVSNSTVPYARLLKYGCRLLPRVNDYFFFYIIHIFLLISAFVLFKTISSNNNLIDYYNSMLVYFCYILSVLPQILMTSIVHIVKEKHVVPFELLINSSLIILIISIFCFLWSLLVDRRLGSQA